MEKNIINYNRNIKHSFINALNLFLHTYSPLMSRQYSHPHNKTSSSSLKTSKNKNSPTTKFSSKPPQKPPNQKKPTSHKTPPNPQSSAKTRQHRRLHRPSPFLQQKPRRRQRRPFTSSSRGMKSPGAEKCARGDVCMRKGTRRPEEKKRKKKGRKEWGREIDGARQRRRYADLQREQGKLAARCRGLDAKCKQMQSAIMHLRRQRI